MTEELACHGCKLSAGTLHPILHGLEARGYLTSTEGRGAGTMRRIYRATCAGAEALAAAKIKVRELFSELYEDCSDAGRTVSAGQLPMPNRQKGTADERS